MKKRMISLLMALAMSLTLLPTTSYAAEESGTAIGAGRLCEHHTAHDDACGYVASKKAHAPTNMVQSAIPRLQAVSMSIRRTVTRYLTAAMQAV